MALNPAQTATENWLDAMTVAFTETPPRRRMVRPLRQHVDLLIVRAPEAQSAGVDPAFYDYAGHSLARLARPGRLLNVLV